MGEGGERKKRGALHRRQTHQASSLEVHTEDSVASEIQMAPYCPLGVSIASHRSTNATGSLNLDLS